MILNLTCSELLLDVGGVLRLGPGRLPAVPEVHGVAQQAQGVATTWKEGRKEFRRVLRLGGFGSIIFFTFIGCQMRRKKEREVADS